MTLNPKNELQDAIASMLDSQTEYVVAQAAYALAAQKARQLWDEVPEDADDLTFDEAFARIESLAPTTTTTYDALRVSEDIMVNACRRLAQLDPLTSGRFRANRTELHRLFSGYRHYPAITAKLIQFCQEFDPYKH